MDSFYDQPRKAPMLKSLSTPAEKILPNVVPDASMLIQNKGNIPQSKSEMSYNAWKYQFRAGAQHAMNKENTLPSKESILRKQVRFETSHADSKVQQKVPNYNGQPVRPSLVNKNVDEIDSNKFNDGPQCRGDFGMPRVENKILQAKPFEKMYLANLPSRNLDLSIIDLPRKHVQRSNSLPEQFNGPSHLNYNNTTPQTVPNNGYNYVNQGNQVLMRKPMAESTTLEVRTTQQKDDDEPSVKDLLKIIHQQNEQLMTLQEQVSTLLKERSQQPQIEAAPTSCDDWKQPIFNNKAENNPGFKTPLANKFAIDVMTSFEVSIRAPNGNRFMNRGFPGVTNENYEKARITEILDESTKSKPSDLSMKLDEPVVVNERCPSPENSIHVDMKDFSSDDEDEDETRSEQLDNSTIGWTIYNNVMGQVNYMLKKSTDGNKESNAQQTNNGQYTGAIMKQVKEATLKHLQKAGISLHNLDDDLSVSSDGAYTPTQVSFAVKQLLMKYLPDEQLTKVINGPNKLPPPEVSNGNYPKNVIKRRPDFSLATVQYMEKYNLLNRDNGNNMPRFQANTTRVELNVGDKMLDITALKQQPKLL